MSTAPKRDSKQIELEIKRTRTQMEGTIDAIRHKFSSRELVNQAVDYWDRMRHGAPSEFATNLGNSVKQNPLAITVAGIGLSWLMISGTNRGQGSATAAVAAHRDNNPKSLKDAGESLKSAKDRAAGMAGDSREKADKWIHKTGDSVDRLKDNTYAAADRVSRRADSAGKQVTHFMREQPLVAGALGIAVGATVAAALASTRWEDDTMGDARDDVVESTVEAGKEQLENVADTAENLKDTVLEDDDAGDRLSKQF